jgi:hypothetical protein
MRRLLLIISTVSCFALTSNAAVLLSTDFDNGGVTAGSMTDVVWIENGIGAVTTLGATNNVRTGLSGDLDAEGGYFSVNTNVNGSTAGAPAWTTTNWTLTVGGLDAELSSIVLVSQEGNSGGLIGGGNGTSNINLSITGTAFSATQLRSTEPDTLTYDLTGVTLLANQQYDLVFSVWEESSQGHFEGFDSLVINGDLVPEPSIALLGALGMLSILRRRR